MITLLLVQEIQGLNQLAPTTLCRFVLEFFVSRIRHHQNHHHHHAAFEERFADVVLVHALRVQVVVLDDLPHRIRRNHVQRMQKVQRR